MRVNSKLSIIIFLLFFINISNALSDDKKVFDKLESLNKMREALASSLKKTVKVTKEEITFETFKTTCMPVGKELMRWANENNLDARQISHKNRNPLNKPSKEEETIYNKFLNNPNLIKHKEESSNKYYYRINYHNSCNSCHGTKENRPEFIQNNYPLDKAYEFKEGELRGVYVVRDKNK